MSRLYGRETRLKITGELRIGKNARIVTEQSDGTEVNTAASAVPTLAAGAATDEMDITIAVRDGAAMLYREYTIWTFGLQTTWRLCR